MPLTWSKYDAAIVLDMLATPGPANVGESDLSPLSEQMLAHARASGVTACNLTVSAVGPGTTVFEQTLANIAFWERELAEHPDILIKVLDSSGLAAAKRTRRLGLIFGFQDGTPFGNDVERVRQFYDLGVRVIQFTYNGRNPLGDGCLEPANGGLTAFGRLCIESMHELGVLVDVSHVGIRTAWDTLHHSAKPIAVTHGGAGAVADVPRNKPDDLLKAIAARGGVIGIYLMPYLRTEGQPHAEDFMRHLDHLLNLCGEDHVGIGSDLSLTPLDLNEHYRAAHAEVVRTRRQLGIGAPSESEDVFTYVPELNSPRRLAMIADMMLNAGYGSRCIEKVVGGNWMRLLAEVWSDRG
jgi:membrane dipeptidase